MRDWLAERFPEFAAACGEYKVKGGDRGKGCCPNKARHKHGDRNMSLLFQLADNGGLVFRCYAGCTKEEVLKAVPGNDLARPWRIVCHDRPPPEKRVMSVVVKSYPYYHPTVTAKDGRPLAWCVVDRYHPKRFQPKRKLLECNGCREWVYSIAGGYVKRVPTGQGTEHKWVPGCRLDRGHADAPAGEVWTQAAEPWPYQANMLHSITDKIVFFVAGEKDADTLAGLGLLATTVQGGEGQRLFPRHWHRLFRGRHVVLMPDHDEAGRDYSRWYAGCLVACRAASVTYIELPGLKEKGDVSDWVFARRDGSGPPGPKSPAAELLKRLVQKASGYSRLKIDTIFKVDRRRKARKAAADLPTAGELEEGVVLDADAVDAVG